MQSPSAAAEPAKYKAALLGDQVIRIYVASDIDRWLVQTGSASRTSLRRRWQHRWNGWSRSWWGEAELLSVLAQPLNTSSPSLLLGCPQWDELDLLAAQLDLKLIAGFQAHLGGVGLADEQVACH